MHQDPDNELEFVLLGAGLANSLLALKLHAQNRRFIILEKKSQLQSSQTWSFHLSDLNASELTWLRPLISSEWPGYDVKFPNHQRHISLPYASICGSTFFLHIEKSLAKYILTSREVKTLGPTYVELSSGEKFYGRCIIDSRGVTNTPKYPTGFQKFLGLELRFSKGHGLRYPLLMDATVAQKDGFRFIYTLPFDEKTLLVEDTRYSDTASIDPTDFRSEILGYVRTQWGEHFEIIREESTALPIPLDHIKPDNEGVVTGLRGGYFHFTTGYSLSWAVKNAFLISSVSDATTEKVRAVLKVRDQALLSQRQYFLFLNRLLFGAAHPKERINIFSRFYKFPCDFISRFYAGKFTYIDRARLLFGTPPVKISRALKALASRSWLESFQHVE